MKFNGVKYIYLQRVAGITPVDDADFATKEYVDDAIVAGGGYTDEQAQDAVGNILAATATITPVYSDATPDITFNINDNSVTFAKLQNLATDKLLGRDTAGSGDPEEISVGGGLEFTGAAAIQRSALTGDVTASAGSNTTTIPSDTVTFAKLQNIATDRLIGRDTAASGDPEEISVGGGLEFTGAGGIQRSALTGDVTASAGSGSTTIPSGTVTFAKMQTIATDRLLGRDTAASGAVEEISVGGGLEFTGSTGIQRSALTGDVTASAGSNTTTIPSDTVTFAKLQNIGTDRLIGRDTALSGDPEEISVGGGLEFSGAGGIQRSALTGDVTASAASNATSIAAAAVTLAKMANLAQDQFIGRTTASTGVPETATITAAARSVLDDTTTDNMLATLGGGTPTGTGVLVRASTPTLTTPVIGAATGTSLSVSDSVTADRYINNNGTFAYSATPTLDLSDKLNWFMTGAMTGNMAVTLSNGSDGYNGIIGVLQDGTGNRLFSLTASGRTVIMDGEIGASFNTTTFKTLNRPALIGYEYVTINSVAYVVLSLLSTKASAFT